MKPFSLASYPKAIIHVDGDAFFVGCETSLNPELSGKPVVTGKERGIASAVSYEAKARGVTRGMPLFKIKQVCPECIILPSNYETYSLFSARMYDIVRRYTPEIEEYSIDECFADITGMRRALGKSYEEIAGSIKEDLRDELGFNFSVGLAPSKVLAKIASKRNKPDGLCFIPAREAHNFLSDTPIEKIWGIGAQTSAYLEKFGITTALSFARQPFGWVSSHLSKPYQEIWHELHGVCVLPVETGGRKPYQSIQKTRTFVPASSDSSYIFSELSKNIENACIKMRRYSLRTARASFFLKTQDFHYHTGLLELICPSSAPQPFVAQAEEKLQEVFSQGVLYRATGVVMHELSGSIQPDLFGQSLESEKLEGLSEAIDSIDKRFGKHSVSLGASFEALRGRGQIERRRGASACARGSISGETARKRIEIPSWGEVG